MFTFHAGRPGINLFDSNKVLFLLWIFLLVFPKGGIKVGGIPITWGYLLLGFVALYTLLRKTWKIHLHHYNTIVTLIPFQLISLLTILLNGYEDTGLTLSFFISYFLLPTFFLLLFSDDIENLNIQLFFKLFKIGVLFIACYGIFLFFFKNITGKFIEIPYLTVNADDVGQLDLKNINRGSSFKLISTYNNGNIFGICLLILLPLYCYLEKKILHKTIVKTSLLFTFSRTVWFTWIFYEVCSILFFSKNTADALKKILIKTSVSFIVLLPILYKYGFLTCAFLLDYSLGGRTDGLNFLDGLYLLSSKSFNGIHEMVYYWISMGFGLMGLATFLLGILGPIMLLFRRQSLQKIHLSIGLGLINHLFASLSDGAVSLLPTMAFYWFMLALFARKKFEEEIVNLTPSLNSGMIS